VKIFEITQREISSLGHQTEKWADRNVNQQYPPEYVDLNQILGPFLKKKGLKNLGSGAFSVVYGRPSSNRIIKISIISDRCWLSFANWAISQNNPHLPKIYHLESYSVITKSHSTRSGKKTIPVFFAVMEKLDALDVETIFTIDEAYMPFLAYVHKKGHGDWDGLLGNIEWGKYGGKRKLIEASKKDPIVKLFQRIEKKWKTCFGDLKLDNLMIRPSTGEIVITDPVYSEYF